MEAHLVAREVLTALSVLLLDGIGKSDLAGGAMDLVSYKAVDTMC